jgi:hypothetical protein
LEVGSVYRVRIPNMTDLFQITQAVRDYFNDPSATVGVVVRDATRLVITYYTTHTVVGFHNNITGRGASVEEALADMKRIHMNLRKQELVDF